MNKLWALYINFFGTFVSVMFFRFKWPLIMSGRWNKTVGLVDFTDALVFFGSGTLFYAFLFLVSLLGYWGGGFVPTCIRNMVFQCCWRLQWAVVGTRVCSSRWSFLGGRRGVSIYYCWFDKLNYCGMGLQSPNVCMVSLLSVEVFWLRRRFAYCSGIWVCFYNRSLPAWSSGVDKGVKTREEGILVADGTSGESLMGCPYVEGYFVMLVPQNVGDDSTNTNRDLLSFLLVRLGNGVLVVALCHINGSNFVCGILYHKKTCYVLIKGLVFDYVLFQENQEMGSDVCVTTSCVGIYVIIKWVLGRGYCSLLLRVLLSNKVQVKNCLMLVHRNIIRLIYDMVMIRVLMYLKICLLVAHFLNFWSYTIFVKGTNIVMRWVWQCLNTVFKE